MVKSQLSLLLALAVCLSCALSWPLRSASAHGIGWSQGTAEAVVLTFYYVGGGAMVDVEARIFAPGDAETPFQVGRTDPLGRVLFVPDRPGAWRVNVVDGEGHEMVASTTAAAAGEVRDPAVGFTGALLLSLTANMFLGIAWWRLRRRRTLDHATLLDESATRKITAPQKPEASAA